MTVHEFGSPENPVVVLIHPSLVMWDYFEYVIPMMQDRYHLIVPALPGYDEAVPGDFTSVEDIASGLAEWLLQNGIPEIASIYGCSMGGAVVIRFLADHRISAHSAVIDGGITPYQLPWILTRFIAARDFLMVCLGKIGGMGLLEKAFATDEYTKEDMQYIAGILKFMSARTIWRTFDSCNNYKMPSDFLYEGGIIEYWYALAEKKARKWDMAYVEKHFRGLTFREFEDTGHGGLAVLRPERMVLELERVIKGNNEV